MLHQQTVFFCICVTAPFLALAFSDFGLVRKAEAAPNIFGVSENLIHGSQVTISGSSFGTKNPAPPVLWDDGENKLDGDDPVTDGPFSRKLPASWAIQGGSSSDNALYHSIPYPSVGGKNAPHSRSTKYITARQKSNESSLGFILEKNNPSAACPTDVFLTAYYANAPSPNPGLGPGANHKIMFMGTNQYFLSGQSLNPCYSQGADFTGQNPFEINDTFYETFGTNTGNDLANRPNGTVWVRHLAYVRGCTNNDNDGFYKFYHGADGDVPMTESVYSDTDPFGSGVSAIDYLAFGGFYRACDSQIPGCSDITMYSYYDDVYMDWSLARVMLSNNQDYRLATIVEPQIPSVWSDGSIVVALNLGKLADSSTAWLFVFDANNNRNEIGYPVTISGGSDITPPAQPTGLTVD